MRISGAVLSSIIVLGLPLSPPAAAETKEKEAGPIWNQADAERKCPTTCKPGAWNGGWRTTVSGKMSVCSCVMPEPSPSGWNANAFHELTTEWFGDKKCLDIVNDGKNNNQPILAACGKYSGQLWKLTPAKDGFHRLTTQWRGDKKCLDIVNDGKHNNRPILADCGDVSGQYWKLAPIKGFFTLTTMWRGDKKCLDIVNDGKHNNQPILADCGDFSGQHWRVREHK